MKPGETKRSGVQIIRHEKEEFRHACSLPDKGGEKATLDENNVFSVPNDLRAL